MSNTLLKTVLLMSVALAVAAPIISKPKIDRCYSGTVEGATVGNEYEATLCLPANTTHRAHSEYLYGDGSVVCTNGLTGRTTQPGGWATWDEVDSDADLCSSGVVWARARWDGCIDHEWRFPNGDLDGSGVLCP